MPAIDTAVGSIFDTSVRTRVYVADALREADFVEQDYLHCSRLTITAAPLIDACELEYEYGAIIREDAIASAGFLPLELVGKFVKVTVEGLEGYDRSITWYGVIERETQQTDGSVNGPSGRQRFEAAGLLKLIDKEVVRASQVANTAEDGVILIKRGVPFNHDPGGYYVRRGNRSGAQIDSAYAFSNEVRTLNAWTAYQAATYLLKYHAPRDFPGTITNTWKFDPTALVAIEGMLDWYDITVPTDGRTVLAILNDLIPRSRGLGYYAEFNPADDTVHVKVFSFVDAELTLPSGATLAANPDAYTLDFESALDIEEAVVSNLETSRYHTVIARGARITSTFTARLSATDDADDVITKDWTSTEQTEYLSAASGDADYDTLTLEEKEKRNARYRAEERLRHVFTRFKFNPDWNQRTLDWHGEVTDEFFISPVIGESDETIDPIYNDPDNLTGEPLWTNGMSINRSLPFLDRYDYSEDKIETSGFGTGFTDVTQPDFIPPFAYIQTADGATYGTSELWELLDKLHLSAHEDGGRRWSAGLSIVDTEPALQFNVNPNHLMASAEWAAGSPAATSAEHDAETAAAINWQNVFVTLCVNLDKHVESFQSIAEPATDAPAGRLIIPVPDARFDWVTPYTTVSLKSGVPEVTTTGGAVRDDRERVEDIARAAAEWYGRPRQTLRLTYRQVRPLFSLGWLITSTGAYYSLENVNTPVTSITYEFGSVQTPGSQFIQRTTIETAFAELDVR